MVRGPAPRLVAIAAGGTGGHTAPAEALARMLIERGHRVAFLTDARTRAFAGRETHVIAGAGLAGRGLKAVGGAAGMLLGIAQAHRLLGRLNPSALVAFGGYPSVAPVLAARLSAASRRRVPVLLHEQNAVMGRANRFLARFADTLALSFETTRGVPSGATVLVTGNPVRAMVRERYPALDAATPLRVLVIGGSLGARVLSDVVPPALVAFGRAVHVTQQCRAEDLGRVRDAYAASGITAELAPFLDDMPRRLAASHLVIARAGASTVAELAVAGRPSILVPLPHAIDDHQAANARALADAGGAWIMPQRGFTADALANLLARIVPDLLPPAARAAAAFARPEAAAQLADLVERAMVEPVP